LGKDILQSVKGMTFVRSSCRQNVLLVRQTGYMLLYTLYLPLMIVLVFMDIFPFTTCLELKSGIGQTSSSIDLPIIFHVLNFVHLYAFVKKAVTNQITVT